MVTVCNNSNWVRFKKRIYQRTLVCQRYPYTIEVSDTPELQFLSPPRVRTLFEKEKEKEKKEEIGSSPRCPRTSEIESRFSEWYKMNGTLFLPRRVCLILRISSYGSFKTDQDGESGHSQMEVNLFQREMPGVSRGPDSFPFNSIDVPNFFSNVHSLFSLR